MSQKVFHQNIGALGEFQERFVCVLLGVLFKSLVDTYINTTSVIRDTMYSTLKDATDKCKYHA